MPAHFAGRVEWLRAVSRMLADEGNHMVQQGLERPGLDVLAVAGELAEVAEELKRCR